MNNALQARVLIEAFKQMGAKRSAEPGHSTPQRPLRNLIAGMEMANAMLQVLMHNSTSNPTIKDV